jgi:hypothetical protein
MSFITKRPAVGTVMETVLKTHKGREVLSPAKPYATVLISWRTLSDLET